MLFPPVSQFYASGLWFLLNYQLFLYVSQSIHPFLLVYQRLVLCRTQVLVQTKNTTHFNSVHFGSRDRRLCCHPCLLCFAHMFLSNQEDSIKILFLVRKPSAFSESCLFNPCFLVCRPRFPPKEGLVFFLRGQSSLKHPFISLYLGCGGSSLVEEG